MLRHAMLTGLILAILVLTGAITAVASAMAVARRRRALPGGKVKALPSGAEGDLSVRGLRELRPGDVITLEARDYLVEGVVTYEEDGHRWNAGRLVDGSDERWLVVGLERGGSLSARVLQHDPEMDVSGYPPEVLVAGALRHTLAKRGTATAQLAGNTGLRSRGSTGSMTTVERCRWWLYEAPGDDTLVVEQWSDAYRVLRGKKVSPTLIELITGS